MGNKHNTMTTANKLEQALAKVQEAVQLLKEAREGNESLAEHYEIEDMERDLSTIASNPKGFAHTTCIQDMLDECGDTWTNEEPT